MLIKINNHRFEGLFTDPDDIQNKPGIYAVVLEEDDKLTVIDLARCEKLRDSLLDYEQEDDWKNHSTSKLRAAVLYESNDSTPQSTFKELLNWLLESEEPLAQFELNAG